MIPLLSLARDGFPALSCGVRFAPYPLYEDSCTPSRKISLSKLSEVRWLLRRDCVEAAVSLLYPGGERLVQTLQL